MEQNFCCGTKLNRKFPKITSLQNHFPEVAYLFLDIKKNLKLLEEFF